MTGGRPAPSPRPPPLRGSSPRPRALSPPTRPPDGCRRRPTVGAAAPPWVSSSPPDGCHCHPAGVVTPNGCHRHPPVGVIATLPWVLPPPQWVSS